MENTDQKKSRGDSPWGKKTGFKSKKRNFSKQKKSHNTPRPQGVVETKKVVKPLEMKATPQGVFTELLPEIQKALGEEGYANPTPIQEQAIPHLIEGRDIIGCAQTGTGKTAAFTLPILQFLGTNKKGKAKPSKPRVLVLAPTRELAAQIGDNIENYSRHVSVSHCVIFGGVSQNPQLKLLRQGMDIVVATPGRLLDLIQQKCIFLDEVEFFVLDEADRMLDMGFLPDIQKVMKLLPKERQSLFFSATMDGDIGRLARSLVYKPAHVTIEPDKPAVERIDQRVYFIEKKKKETLLKSLIKENKMNKVIVFTQMKHVANKVAQKLQDAGIKSGVIHGNKSQSARTMALDGFKQGKVRVLVATDIAARGIDVDKITHVINYDMPNEPETYIHRIGRTARAGTEGEAHSFCSAEERNYLRHVEALMRKEIPVITDHPFHCEFARTATGEDAKPAPKQRGRQQSGKKFAKLKGGKRSENYSKSGFERKNRSRSPKSKLK